MRADAARNRQRIHDAARQAIAAGDTTLTLNELARRAEVGVGTVYRVFPTQRAMLEAVLEDSARDLIRLADAAERESDPHRALEEFLRTALAAALEQPGLFNVLITVTDETDALRRAKAELVTRASQFLGRLHPAPALTGENLLKLFCGLIHAISEHPEDRRPAATDAYLQLLRAGLTAGPAG
ncbi:TetR family transcriptional regulator [Streptomyces carpaticus]|uniref:TetR/AcrR family transcriptional regulator n=1 Tax=Streptomyces TaxID=1883 RepID=UPI001FF9886B|nr:TetR family transcriptional regulator [Streptomyces sp. XM4011]MCK1814367.1 TetR family transcriptional regulator [Streptomyces sp. XM4011]UWM51991.1 TetR family transcriptional regulator [Streptomyces carpaticus]